MNDDALRSLGRILRQAQAGILWARRHLMLAVESGASAEEASDHLHAAHEDLLAPLAATWPSSGKAGHEAEDDAQIVEAAASFELPERTEPALGVVREITERVGLLLEDARVVVAELEESPTLSGAQIEDVREGLSSAADAIEAAISASDPSRQVAADDIHSDAEIASVGVDLRAEVLREVVQETGKHMESLRRASEKLKRLRTSRLAAYVELRSQLLAARREDVPRLLAELMRLGFDHEESRALVGIFAS